MNPSGPDEVEDPQAQGASRASLQAEHAVLLREVRRRAESVISMADEGRWPERELRELLNYLHLEILRQVVEEEWLLFRLIRHASDELARMRREHLELRLAIEELDQAAATAGDPRGLSPLQLSAITRDLLTQLEAHFAAEDELAISGRAAPATTSLGAQPHEWYRVTAGPVIDLDQLLGPHGAEAAMDRLRRLETSEQVEIRSSSDPGPLCHRLTAVDPGGYGITYLERGPDRWRVEIVRRPQQTALRPYA
jgi:uncharacterized protein (DUF2249 family)/hemerythrin-like domain-containing protein